MNRTAALAIAAFVSFAGMSFAQSGTPDRWTILSDQSIRWDVKSSDLPHRDHIEMTGASISCVLRWGIDESGAFSEERSLVFPLLRTLPNDTHASLNHRTAVDVPSLLSIDGLALRNENVTRVRINGMVEVESTFEAGQGEFAAGRASSSAPAVSIHRTITPDQNLPVLIEKYEVKNIRNSPLTLYVPSFTQLFSTPEDRGLYGSYRILSRIEAGAGTFRLAPGEKTVFYYATQAYPKSGKPTSFASAALSNAVAARAAFVSEVSSKLVLETPDEVINTMFRHAKIRASDSIISTLGGLMHAPGGEAYYAAIWANDQAEYVNPFFPFLGYENGNESALNSFRHFARFMNSEYRPIPSSIIAEGTDIWNGAGDRGDAAMIAYGASRYALALGEPTIAKELWPLIEWCLEYCRRHLNAQGVVESDTDELEGRFPAGKANLCTSSLYYDALNSACCLAKSLGVSARDYAARAKALKLAIESYFGRTMEGYETYRYYDGNDVLRSWICMPLTVGIYDRAPGTVAALFGPWLWTGDGLLTAQGERTFWDRSTLYALRGVFAAGYSDRALEKLHAYSQRRLLGDHVPYAIEAWPEGSQRHLSAENGLYCRVITEGLFGIRPTGFKSFDITPSLPSAWDTMSLKGMRICRSNVDISVSRLPDSKVKITVTSPSGTKTYTQLQGTTLSVKL